MHTDVLNPMRVFALPQHLVVPLFQRPYVWDEREQWQPLWQDVRRMAELRLAMPGSQGTHFLGAVVLQAQEAPHGAVAVKNVIDGQQRLTTLQILMDATGAVLEEAGHDKLARRLEALTHNDEIYAPEESDRLKIKHTNKDRGAFDEVMRAEPPVDHAALKSSASRIVRAHEYFMGAVAEWLGDPGGAEHEGRAGALEEVLEQGLQLVVIDLLASENSQEIFETLNARGTPLTAADLIKNFVFQRLDAEGADTHKVYLEVWPFDRSFWEADVSVGRLTLSRSSLFLNQWLGSRTGEEVSPKQTFSRFKHFVEHESTQKMADLLEVIRVQADIYEGWTRTADEQERTLAPVEMCVYRMKATGTEVLKPVLLWLHEPEREIPQDVIDRVVGVMESWLMRRQLLRLQSADQGRVVAELIRVHRSTHAEALVPAVTDHLARFTAASTYWPGDLEVRRQLPTMRAYTKFPRGRLRMFLEAVEDRLRASYDYGQVPRRGYPIEHLMPQKWQSSWPVDGLDAELERADHVHRLGNLTLLTSALNSSVSNGPWLGADGKRARLEKYDVLLLNREVRAVSAEGWDEASIDARTDRLIDILLEVWPVPPGHEGTVSATRASVNTWVEIKDLVGAGLLAPGTRLVPRAGAYADSEAYVTDRGMVQIGDLQFSSPSSAGRHVRGGSTNGWTFWGLEDGRRLSDVRAQYKDGSPPEASQALEWWGPDDSDDARALWDVLPDGARSVVRAVADAAPETITMPELSKLLGVKPTAVGGRLSWTWRKSAEFGHHFPVRYIEGEPAEYWMDAAAAELFTKIAEGLDEAGQ
ncbi:DUF262 domain-containing protein [Isoptericola sp. b408]|uniref:GmrSD restriction endonuclease domain-containing protein n=1 Tax=Isoptericola sp. b408 TaxID=3064653 RepID=UPI0027125210|nr:DUF262 domain-containing protein [Isoptericola sp. b408]MDO8150204.1 DUF262 domain-containing protein [Isoptericola sp. b408]